MEMKRHIGRLIGVLVILVVFAYLTGTFDRAPSTVDVPDIDLDTAKIEGIEIEHPDFSLRAQRVNGRWQLTEPVQWLADSSAIMAFTRSLAGLDLGSVVSTNPERYGRYGVDSTGSDVRINVGTEVLHIVVSQEGPDFSTSYVRLDDDERVFIGRPRVSLPVNANRWRDRFVTRISESSVETVTVVSSTMGYSIQKTGQEWIVLENGESSPTDSAAVASLFNTYALLRADGFLDAASLSNVSDSLVHRVSFRMSGGDVQDFTVSELDNELALQFSGMSTAVFRFFTSRKAALVPDANKLRGGE